MPSFPDPDFPYAWEISDQVAALRIYRDQTPGPNHPTISRIRPRPVPSHILGRNIPVYAP